VCVDFQEVRRTFGAYANFGDWSGLMDFLRDFRQPLGQHGVMECDGWDVGFGRDEWPALLGMIGMIGMIGIDWMDLGSD